jgi:hypothetical protein
MKRRGRNGSVMVKRHPRWSLVAALLAVFCQIVATAAMPSAAWGGVSGLQEAQAFNGPICHGGSDHQPAPNPEPNSCHHCTLCHATHGAGSVVAPASSDLPPVPISIIRIGFPSDDLDLPPVAAAGHQARAPPPSV